MDRYSSPVIGRDSKYYGRIWTFRDITDRKKAEEDLRKSREKYQNIFENSIMGIYQSMPGGRYLSVNLAFARLFGYDSPEELMASVTDIGHQFYVDPRDRDRAIKTILEKGFLEGFELEARRKDGTKFWVSMNTRIAQDENGTHFDGTVENITERKQMEKALRESRDYLDKIINSIGDPIFVIDRHHRHILVNDAMCALANRTREEFIGKTPYDFFPREQVEGFLQKDEVVFETGEENVNEETITDSQGVTRTVVTKKTLYTDASGNKSIVGIIRDITDRKKAEEELRQNRDHLEERVRERTAEMERFIYTVSHDLRSPLVTVSGFVGLLKGDLESGDSQRAFSDLVTISEAITKMDCLLVDTLELSRIGRVANPPVDVSFDKIVQEAIRQTEERIKSLDVAVYVAGDMPKVRVDVLRIVEVLVNLIENSVKYIGDQERPEIDIGSRKFGEETVFFVKDNGIGIDPKEHEKVFGLFYKVDRKSEGTGVGLAIVKRIIEVHGGRIWIESELGKGCTVCFTLPLADYQ